MITDSRLARCAGRMTVTACRRLAGLVLVSLMAAAPCFAQAAPDLSRLSIEDLMNLEVTSASRKPQRSADVAGALFVITHDVIQRSGMMTVPDLLRMVPGVDVAQINANKWAVSVRGFNSIYANKLLILVDGRTIYNRLFSGVLWDGGDLMLDDIDRIEVIRGPGAALWGANAVNGVINIVTKTSAETSGGLLRVDGGGSGAQGAARYGGVFKAATYRLYSQWTRLDESLHAPGIGANDASHNVTTGFRADWTARQGVFFLDGAYTAGETRALWPNLDPKTAAAEPIANEPSAAQGGHFLARWTHTRPDGTSLQLQSFADMVSRQETLADFDQHTFDVDFQYHTALGSHQDLVAGAGYRHIGDRYAGHVGTSLSPATEQASLSTAFVQDQVALLNRRLEVTVGSQAQYDSVSGGGLQPAARVLWRLDQRQRLWAAASRAIRTPSIYERAIRFALPPTPTESGLPLYVSISGNPAAETERFKDVELGYRAELGTIVSVDVTGFEGRYDRLRTQEPSAPVIQFVPSPQISVQTEFQNLLQASTRGLEVAAHWVVVPGWTLDGSYTAFRLVPHLDATSLDPLAGLEDGSAPRTQWQLRSAYAPASRATLAVALFHVGSLTHDQAGAYTRADVTAEWRFHHGLSATLIGQNLLQADHAEFGGSSSFLQVTRVPRSLSVRLRWTLP